MQCSRVKATRIRERATTTIMALWKFNCLDHIYHGMWQRWYRNQCVAVGYAADWGYYLEGDTNDIGWSYTRNRLMEMVLGDYVVVALRGDRVGRIGEITGMAFGDDEWDPLVPPGPDMQGGEMGRRVRVRWDLTVGPNNQDLIVQLPVGCRFQPGQERVRAVAQIQTIARDELVEVMNDPSNWVSLLGNFPYEEALSDYIANYPNHLEDGLLPHPNSNIREHRFNDGRRADVLLIDKSNRPVIVECKRHAPSVQNIRQLRGYMLQFEIETGQLPRGILVHGGAQKLISEVINDARLLPTVEVVSYTLNVDFKA